MRPRLCSFGRKWPTFVCVSFSTQQESPASSGHMLNGLDAARHHAMLIQAFRACRPTFKNKRPQLKVRGGTSFKRF